MYGVDTFLNCTLVFYAGGYSEYLNYINYDIQLYRLLYQLIDSLLIGFFFIDFLIQYRDDY